MNKFMNKLREKRKEKKLTQLDLANLTMVSRQTINMIESQQYNPTLQLCIKICKVLGCTLDEIFWEEDNV